MKTIARLPILAALVAFTPACGAPPESVTPDEAVHDAPVAPPPDLRKLTAVVRVTPPERLRQEFEAAAARIADPDIAAFLRAQASGGFGSGFVVVRHVQGKQRALVVTNRHVIENAQEAEVGFSSGTTYAHCPVVYVHPTADLAVIALPEDAPFSSGLEIDSGTLRDRDTVVATGYPALGGQPSFQTAEGKISNADFEGGTLIQHTAAIDPGSSGGPLTNERGRVVGVNVALARDRQNVNFAIRATTLAEAVSGAVDLLEHKTDAAYLRKAVAASCNRLAAELASTAGHGGTVMDFIGISLVATQGPESYVFFTSQPKMLEQLRPTFVRDPIDAYRLAVGYRIVIRALAEGGVRPGTRCEEPNPSDAMDIVGAHAVRVVLPTARGGMELAFALDRGTYRIVGGDLLDVSGPPLQAKGARR